MLKWESPLVSIIGLDACGPALSISGCLVSDHGWMSLEVISDQRQFPDKDQQYCELVLPSFYTVRVEFSVCLI